MEYRIQSKQKTGTEAFAGMSHTLLDFWRWAHSDIASNSERGKLAEYIVKCAVDAPAACRVEWDSVDVISPEGIRIEVKSSAYLQTWRCNKLSTIQFDIAPKKSWDSETNQYFDFWGRNSDIYVFCLFACKNPSIADPLDLSQWDFFILQTSVLDSNIPTQKTITLNSLLKLGAVKTQYQGIRQTIASLMSK